MRSTAALRPMPICRQSAAETRPCPHRSGRAPMPVLDHALHIQVFQHDHGWPLSVGLGSRHDPSGGLVHRIFSMLATRASSRATRRRALSRFSALFASGNRPLGGRKACCAWSSALGLAKVRSSEHVASVLIPKSTPSAGPVAGVGSGASMTTCTDTNQRPPRSETVALRMCAPTGR